MRRLAGGDQSRSASSARRDGKEALLAVDAKMSLDDNALYRHPNLQAMRDLAEEAPLETEASKFNLNYIKLDGNIACLVNGAGLAMATMDIIQHFGGRPANFLDVGGGASQEQVAAAFKIILQDPNVKGILVNIFGGIMDCNVIATGIVAAVKETGLQAPAGGPARRQQRRGRQEDPRRIRPHDHPRRLDGRRRAEGGQAVAGTQLDEALIEHSLTMSILVTPQTRVLVQGITGSFGARHTQLSLAYGTQVVAGVTPGKGGQLFENKVPIFDTVAEAMKQTGATASAIFVPPGLCGRRDPRRRGCRPGPRRLHHRRHPGQRHGQGEAGHGRQEDPADRPQLPRHRHARRRARIRTAAAASASRPATFTSKATSASSPAAAP